MGQSTCVSCGECAISCPTGALEFQPSFIETQIKRVRDEMEQEKKDGDIVTADELIKYPLFSRYSLQVPAVQRCRGRPPQDDARRRALS